MSIFGGATSLTFGGDLYLGAGSAPAQITGNNGLKRLSLPTTSGGTAKFHGQWNLEDGLNSVNMGTSDRRLKENIAPLSTQLKKRQAELRGHGEQKDSAVSWVLRELRPVSFRFKSTSEAKSLHSPHRFGFLAQEVQRLAPDMAYTDGGQPGEGPMALFYQDLLAVLTLAFKEQQTQLTRQHVDVSQAQEEVNELLEGAEALEKLLDVFEAESNEEAMEDQQVLEGNSEDEEDPSSETVVM